MSQTSSSSTSVWLTWLTQHLTAPSTLFSWKISRGTLPSLNLSFCQPHIALETGCLENISAALRTSWLICPSWPRSAAIAAWRWRDTWPSPGPGVPTCLRRLVFCFKRCWNDWRLITDVTPDDLSNVDSDLDSLSVGGHSNPALLHHGALQRDRHHHGKVSLSCRNDYWLMPLPSLSADMLAWWSGLMETRVYLCWIIVIRLIINVVPWFSLTDRTIDHFLPGHLHHPHGWSLYHLLSPRQLF